MRKLWKRFLNLIRYTYTVCEIKDGNYTITLLSNGMVITSDGYSTDALPIYLVSQELIEEFVRIVQEEDIK